MRLPPELRMCKVAIDCSEVFPFPLRLELRHFRTASISLTVVGSPVMNFSVQSRRQEQSFIYLPAFFLRLWRPSRILGTGDKTAGRRSWPPQSSAKIVNVWSYFPICLHGAHRDNFTFTFICSTSVFRAFHLPVFFISNFRFVFHINIILPLPLLLPNCLFPSGFPTKILHTPLLFPIRATWPTHLIWSTGQYLVRSTDYEAGRQ